MIAGIVRRRERRRDACIAVVAWKEDGDWDAQSISAEKEDDGTVEVTTRRRGPG